MQRGLFSLLTFFITALFVSCTKTSGNIDDVQWLAGKWRGNDRDRVTWVETWNNSTNKSLSGYILALTEDGDTVLHENPKIDLVDGVPYFITTVPKNPSPVLFKMLGSSDASNAIFENREQDFPQRITYSKISDAAMQVTLEGTAKGVPKTETLKFERVKDSTVHLGI